MMQVTLMARMRALFGAANFKQTMVRVLGRVR
jgi:hypothetical protein